MAITIKDLTIILYVSFQLFVVTSLFPNTDFEFTS